MTALRVAFLVNEFPALSETFLLDQATGLLERGCDVDVFGERPREGGARHPGAARLESRFHAYRAPRSYARRLLEAVPLVTAGGRPLLRSLNAFRYGVEGASLNLLFEAAAFAGRQPYDVVHAHFGPNGTTGVRLRSLGAIQGPLVTTFYGYDLSRHVARHGRRCYERLARTGDLFLALGESMRDELLRLGFPPGRVVVHRLGVDVHGLAARRRAVPTRGGPTRLVSIARLTEKKGIPYGLRAVSALVRRGHRVDYTVIGEGPERRRLETLVHDLGLSGRVALDGARTRPDVLETLARADVLIAPSVTASDGDREGTPVAILEAQAMAIPVVATRHAGIPEIVADGVSGLLVDERDDLALADAIERLILEPSLGERLGRAGHAAVASRHDIDPLNDTLAGLYRGLTGGP